MFSHGILYAIGPIFFLVPMVGLIPGAIILTERWSAHNRKDDA